MGGGLKEWGGERRMRGEGRGGERGSEEREGGKDEWLGSVSALVQILVSPFNTW